MKEKFQFWKLWVLIDGEQNVTLTFKVKGQGHSVNARKSAYC